MSSSTSPDKLRDRVKQRANHSCEYCLVPDSVGFYPHEVDHIIAVKHSGKTSFDNLAYACWRCNRHKGSDLASVDPTTGEIVLLFHPRQQLWSEHFRLDGSAVIGVTATGRATVALLQMNRPDRLRERQRLLRRSTKPSSASVN